MRTRVGRRAVAGHCARVAELKAKYAAIAAGAD
jgi:hypothetical protein